MKVPPEKIDGASVLFWARSEKVPFFTMPDGEDGIQIVGLAVCRYDDTVNVYRFSCNEQWEAENDTDWGQSTEAAMTGESGQYDVKTVRWIKYGPTHARKIT